MAAEKTGRPDGAAELCPDSPPRPRDLTTEADRKLLHLPSPGATASLADRVMGNIRGGTDAQRLLQVLRAGLAPADALHEALQLELATGDPERLRGFARAIQKTLEQALGA